MENPRNNIGTLRLAGALAVLFGHCFVLTLGANHRDPISDLTRHVVPYHLGLPGLGVAMFFAISGFLVTRSFVRRRGFIAYAEARILRIYPALILAVALTLIMGALVSTAGSAYLTSKETLAYGLHNSTLLGLQFDLPGVFTGNPSPSVNGSLWTLPVEFRMYILVAIAGVAGALGRRGIFNAVAALAVAVTLIWPDSSPLLAKADHEQLAVFFLAGAVLYMNEVPLTGFGLLALSAVAGVAALVGVYPLFFAFGFAYAVLWVGTDTRIRMPDLAARGDLSYGTYLYAFPVAQLWISALHPSSAWPVVALTLVTTLPLAWVSWHVVETQALRLKGSAAPRLARLMPARRPPKPS